MHPITKSTSTAALVSGIIVYLLGRYVLKGQVDPVVSAEIYGAVPGALTLLTGLVHYRRLQRGTLIRPGERVTISRGVASLDITARGGGGGGGGEYAPESSGPRVSPGGGGSSSSVKIMGGATGGPGGAGGGSGGTTADPVPNPDKN